jgi:hypothetical protein
MDYNQWLLDLYTLNIAPETSSAGFAQIMTLVASGAIFVSFGNVVYGFYSETFLKVIMPDVITQYNSQVFVPADEFIEGPLNNYLKEYGLEPVINIID